MSDCKIYPADTVDIYGNAWLTVGENIRNGLFGENVKVGYVNINKGDITSTDFIILIMNETTFRINKINCLLYFIENIEEGRVNISYSNFIDYTILRNSINNNEVIATIKIIYKDII